MSLNANASNATNGLVFNYDASNNKSYRSPPIKNILNQITPRGLSVGALYNFSSGTENVYIPALGSINNCQYVDMYNDYNGGSGNCCPSPYGYGDSLVVLPSTLYTYAIVYKSTNGYTHPNYMYHYEFTSGGTYLTEYGVFANNGTTAKIRSLGNDWYWASATFTSNASAGLMNTGSWMYEYGRFNRFHVAKAMLVQGNYIDMPPSLWPALNTTVSNTQAILDLTGSNTITVNNLTYASDGTFSFNGSNSLTVPFNPSAFTFNNEQTIIIWMKNEASVAARRNPYNQAYGGGGTITHENNTNFNYYYGTSGVNNVPYTAHTSPFSVVFNETAQIAITRSVSQTAWYKNGALGNTQANPYGSTVVTGTSPILLGTGYTTGVIGGLYAVQIYNRALSAAEVEQNFNALRGRFGI